MIEKRMPLFVYNFHNGELNKVKEICDDKDVSINVIQADLYNELKNSENPVSVAYFLRNKKDYENFRNISIFSKFHHILCVIDINKRDIYNHLILNKDIIVSFYPIIEEELKRALNHIIKKSRNSENKKRLEEGLLKNYQEFVWDTKTLNINSIAMYATEQLYLGGYGHTSGEFDTVVLALEEALINSSEHGNLELDSSLKPQSIMGVDKYEELKKKRLQDPLYSQKKIKMTIDIEDTMAKITIIDEGKGFDISAYNNIADQVKNISEEELLKSFGKGMYLINRAFDKIIYRKDGREINLIKEKKGDVS